MNYIIGLGNPEDKYVGTRHNVGREIVGTFAKKFKFPDFTFEKKYNALISEGKIEKEKVMLILPETFMNKSGSALKKIITSGKKAEKMTVVYDDLDLGLGTVKINFNRGDGGHRGLLSVIKAIKTKSFPRLRIGTSPKTPAGKIKKPQGEEKVIQHVLSKFNKKEEEEYQKVVKKAVNSLEKIVTEGYLKAMNSCNS